MTMIPSFRPLVVAAAALLLSVYPTLLEAQGQAQGQVRPSFPPGLHDRTLPPGTPFDSEDFQPLGREDDSWMMPGMAAATPVGFGAGFGTVWAGVS